MNPILVIQNKIRSKVQESRAILDKATAESRALSAEEQTQLEGVKAEIQELRKTEAVLKEQESLEGSLGAVEGRGNPAIKVRDLEAEKPFRNLGEQLVAVASATRNHFQGVDKRLLRLNAEARATGLNESIPSDGGFLVQKDFASEMLTKAHEAGQLSSRCREMQIGAGSNGLKMNAIDETSRATGSRWGGVRGYWVNEAGSPTASKPKFRQMDIPLQKLAGILYATEELLADSTALGSVIGQAFPEEFAFLLDEAILRGDGSGKPLGVLNSAALVTVAKETGQSASTIVYENIVKMWARCYGPSRANSFWAINQDIEPELQTMSLAVALAGVPVYLPPNGLSESPFGTLLGRPVVPVEQASTLGTVGDISLLDLSQYLLIRKGGVEMAESMHVEFVAGETAFRFQMRINGQPMWNAPLTPNQGSNTQSPLVTLATRA